MSKEIYVRGKLLTFSEVRKAAEEGVPVWYEEKYHSKENSYMNYNAATTLEPADNGYYIGNSDIDLDLYKEDDEARGEFPEGVFAIYKAVKRVSG